MIERPSSFIFSSIESQKSIGLKKIERSINMTKSTKTLAAFTMAAILAGGSIFAQSSDAKKADNDKQKAEFRRMEPRRGKIPTDQTVIIGQVKKVDTKESSITITNTDGKDVSVKVTPFTDVDIVPATRPNPKDRKEMNGKMAMKGNKNDNANADNAKSDNREAKASDGQENGKMQFPPMRRDNSIEEVRKGSWILAATYKTDTKVPAASQIVVKQDRLEKSDTIDAK
jgi:hypothetical protein